MTIEDYEGELYANKKGVFTGLGITAKEIRLIIADRERIKSLENENSSMSVSLAEISNENANLKISIASVKTLFDSLFSN